jgi:hypothetical protein
LEDKFSIFPKISRDIIFKISFPFIFYEPNFGFFPQKTKFFIPQPSKCLKSSKNKKSRQKPIINHQSKTRVFITRCLGFYTQQAAAFVVYQLTKQRPLENNGKDRRRH